MVGLPVVHEPDIRLGPDSWPDRSMRDAACGECHDP
jgi:hypothetical protein